jgi:hypothetical protein
MTETQKYIRALEHVIEHVQAVGMDRRAYKLIEAAAKINLQLDEDSGCNLPESMKTYSHIDSH